MQAAERDDARTLRKRAGASQGGGGGGPVLPLAPLPRATSGGTHSSPAPGRPSSQRDFGSSSKLGKSLSEPRCTCTASRLDLCASEMIFQSLYNTQWSTRTEHLQPLRQQKEDDGYICNTQQRRGDHLLSFFFLFLLRQLEC